MKTINEERTLFMAAFKAAKEIKTRQPWREQPEKFDSLLKAVNSLGKKQRNALVYRLSREILDEEDAAIAEPLFAVATVIRRRDIAFATLLIQRIMKQIPLRGLESMESIALIKLQTDKNGRPRVFYCLDREAFTEAAQKLKEMGKNRIAKEIEEYLLFGRKKEGKK